MATTPNCTILSCSDTPLAIAASVTGFYTTAVAIALSLWGWTVLVQRHPAELEALNQEVLNLDLEIALLNANAGLGAVPDANAGVGSKSSDNGTRLDTLEDYMDKAILQATMVVSHGESMLAEFGSEFGYGQCEEPKKSKQFDLPKRLKRSAPRDLAEQDGKSEKLDASKNPGRSEQPAWAHLGRRLKWVFQAPRMPRRSSRKLPNVGVYCQHGELRIYSRTLSV